MPASVQPPRPLWKRLFRWFATPALLIGTVLLWLVLVEVGVSTFWSGLIGSIVMMAGMNVGEVVLARTDLPARLPGTMVTDMVYTGITTIAAVFVPTFIYIPLGHAIAESWGLTELWSGLPRWAAILICIGLIDFTSYWWHRIQHTSGDTFLWRIHSVHHSAIHYDFWMGARVHPIDVLGFALISHGFVALLGLPVEVVEFGAYFAAMVGAVHHTSMQTDCKWLNRIIPMGDHHILHHSLHEEHNGNFGNITTFFDTLFGTYVDPWPEESPPQGAWSLAEDYPQADFWFILLSPWGRFWKRAKRQPPTG